MPYSLISGNSDTANGKLLGRFWEAQKGEKLSTPFGAIGVLKDAKIISIILLTEYTGSNVEIHIVGYKNWLKRDTLKYLGDYIFNQLGCNVLRIKPYSTNTIIINIAKKIGFEHEAILEDYYGVGIHANIMKLTKDKAKKWIYVDAKST